MESVCAHLLWNDLRGYKETKIVVYIAKEAIIYWYKKNVIGIDRTIKSDMYRLAIFNYKL